MRLFLVLSMIALLQACTWVSASPDATSKGIIVLDQDRVAQCRLMSKTDVSIADKVGVFNRMPSDVAHDLQNLAVNEAAASGGDTVSPLTPVTEGKQTFGIYKCIGSTAGQTSAAPAVSTAMVKTTPYTPPR